MIEPESSSSTAPLAPATDGAHARVRRFRLVVIAGPDAGATYVSRSDRTVIGTHEAADLVLSDETVSRFHCEIGIGAEQAVLRDLGSRNGTVIDGVRVVEAFLADGATIAIGRTQLRYELRADDVQIAVSTRDRFGTLVGRSVSMRRVFSLLERAAESDVSVLIVGETGTGKEAAAESIHAASRRRDGPFVVVDCGAIPPSLLEAELFGHEKGAFTGATSAREGAFDAADGGTIFLDEVGELPLELQPKLLRVVEKKEIKPVGTSVHRAIDVRIIAATNQNLRELVNQKAFRSDLYYRLAVVEIGIPPLRERPEDIPLLVEQLLASLGRSGAEHDLSSPAAIAELARHRWTGNVRELRNHLERCVALGERIPLEAEERVEPLPDCDQPLKIAREQWSRVLERRYVAEVLRRHDGNVSAAARAAKVDRMHFYRLLWRHGLR